MSDSTVCNKCFVRIEEPNAKGHEKWHHELNAKIQGTVQAAVTTTEQNRARAVRNANMGGRPVN